MSTIVPSRFWSCRISFWAVFAIAGLCGCVHFGTRKAADLQSTDALRSQDPAQPWLQLAELRRISFGVSDQSQVTGDSSHLFWTRTANQASTIVHQGPLDGAKLSASLRPIFSPQFDTLDPAWNGPLGQLAYVSFESSARGKICISKLDLAVRKAEGDADSTECFDHPGRVSQPVWGPEGRVFFLMNALPWEEKSNDSIWILDPASRLSRKVTEYPRIASFDVNPTTGDLVAIGWRQEGVGVRRSRAALLLVAAKGPSAFRDPQNGYAAPVPFTVDAAGLPATPRFEPDGKQLYWSQFIADSNEDARVDADDRSVVVAADFPTLRAQVMTQSDALDGVERRTTVVPMQLTAAAAHCMYPRVIGEQLYVTCAPDAPAIRRQSEPTARQLDIYSLPRQGLVPVSWSEEVLLQVRQQARDPSVQLLLTNVLRARLANKDTASDQQSALLLDLVGLHVRAQQSRAASELLEIWNAHYSQERRTELAAALELVLEILKLRKAYAGNEIAAAYRESLEALSLRAKSLDWENAGAKGEPRAAANQRDASRAFAHGLVQLFLDGASGASRAQEAEQVFARQHSEGVGVGLKGREPPRGWTEASFDDLMLILAGQWIETAFEQQKLDRVAVVRLYMKLADYGFEDSLQVSLSFALRAMELARADAKSQAEVRSRGFLAPVLEDLRVTQIEALDLVHAAVGSGSAVDEPSRARFRNLNDRIEKTLKKHGGLAYRAQASVVGATLADANQMLLFGYHVTNWLSKTPIESYEYGVLLEFYRSVTFQRAYDAWDKKDFRTAADIFYTAIRLTRDEEAHLGFILCALASGQSNAQLSNRYAANTSALGPLLSGVPLLRAVSALVEYEKSTKDRPGSVEFGPEQSQFLDDALAALEQPQATVPIVQEFIRGYVAHERFRASLGADRPWWQPKSPLGDLAARDDAIQNLSSALDRSLRRGHVRSAMRAQLGKLHLLAGNAGLSADLLAAALADLGEGAPERAEWTLIWARALARSGRAAKAFAALDALGVTADVARQRGWPWWNGLLAFYAAESGAYERACALARDGDSTLQRLAVAKASSQRFVALGELEHQAWACLKTGKTDDRAAALTLFQQILADTSGTAPQGSVVSTARQEGREPLQILPGLRLRNDFLDSHPAQLRARAAGFLAQLETMPQRQASMHAEREAALKQLLAAGPRIALPPRTIQLYLAKTCTERALQLLKIGAYVEFGQSLGCAVAAVEAIARAGSDIDAADGSGEPAGLMPSLDDFQALRHVTLIALAATRYGVGQVESGHIQKLVKVFDSSFGNLPQQEAKFGSWGPDLLQVYLQTGITLQLARSLQAAAEERHTGESRGSLSASDWKAIWQRVAGPGQTEQRCSDGPASGVSSLLSGQTLVDYVKGPRSAALGRWCQNLLASFGS